MMGIDLLLFSLPVISHVRSLIVISMFIVGLAIYQYESLTKIKEEHTKIIGKVTYFSTRYKTYPSRFVGEFRYLKVDAVPFVFEIYEPHNNLVSQSIDDISIGDKVDIYYLENFLTKSEEIKRWVRFVDVNGSPYYEANDFQLQTVYVLMGAGVAVTIFALVLWSFGKIPW